jgi:hypothetical protein
MKQSLYFLAFLFFYFSVSFTSFGQSSYAVSIEFAGRVQNSFSDLSGNVISGGSSGTNFYLVKTNELDGSEVYVKTYQFSLSSTLVDASLASNGDYLFLFDQSLGGVNHNCIVVRLDQDGNLIWQKEYGGIVSKLFPEFVKSSPSGDIIFGGRYSNGNSYPFLGKLNSSGDLQFLKEYNEEYGYFKDVEFLAGNYFIVGTGGVQSFAGFFDSNGEPISASIGYNSGGAARLNQVIKSNDGGFLAVGQESGVLGSNDLLISKYDQNGVYEWSKIAGGLFNDKAVSITKAGNNGYVIGGTTQSANSINNKAWFFKITLNGDLIWSKLVGGDSFNDDLTDVIATDDLGLIVSVSDLSNNENFKIIKTDYFGDLSCGLEDFAPVYEDYLLSHSNMPVITSNLGGEQVTSLALLTSSLIHTMSCQPTVSESQTFQKVIVAPNNDAIYDVKETLDGGVIMAGSSVTGVHGQSDCFLSRLDRDGDTLWTKFYGSASSEASYGVLVEDDGTFLFISTLGVLTSISGSGDVISSFTYGNTQSYAIEKTSQSNYLIGNSGSDITKLDNDLNPIWSNSYIPNSRITDFHETANGDYLVCGVMFGGANKAFVFRVDTDGNLLWMKEYDSGGSDVATGIVELSNGNLMVSGYTSGYGFIQSGGLILVLNSAGDLLHTKTINGYRSLLQSIVMKNGFPYLAGEYSDGDGDALFMKLTNSGDLIWSNNYGYQYGGDVFNSISATNDNGFVLAGRTSTFGNGSLDFYILKTDSLGNGLGCHNYNDTVVFSDQVISETNIVHPITAGFSKVVSTTLEGHLNLFLRNMEIVSDISGTNNLCSGASNGSVSVEATSGIGPYDYSWSNGGTDAEIENLTEGEYIVTITDNAGCEMTDSVELIDPELLTSSVAIIEPSCASLNNGSAEVNVLGGVAPYSFQWNNGQVDSIATNLYASNYSVTIVDNNGCVHGNIASLSEPEPIEITFTSVNATCGAEDGVIIADATGGDDNFTYLWDTGAIGNDIDEIESGSYSVTVEDGNGCDLTESFDLGTQVTPTEICMITVDSTSNKNLVVWEKEMVGNISGYNVYRNVLGAYQNIGYVSYADLSEFTDNSFGVDPNVTSYRYKISKVDTCGNESELSEFHETMHLTTNLGTAGEINLIWDEYEGFPFVAYRIMKDTTDNGIYDYYEIDVTGSGTFTWTDSDPGDFASYSILVDPLVTCTSEKANDYNSSRSNRSAGVALNGGGDVGINEFSENDFSVYPNPNNGRFTIQTRNTLSKEFEIIDIYGKVILNRTIQAELEEVELNVAVGIYFVRLKNDTFSEIKRITIR